MTSEVVVTLFELVCIVSIGLAAGIYFSPPAAVVSFILSPIMVIGMYLMLTMQFGNKGGRLDDAGGQGDELDNYQKSNALLSDLVINYRTIISLGQKNVDTINETF